MRKRGLEVIAPAIVSGPMLVAGGGRPERPGVGVPGPGGLLADLVWRAALVDSAADAIFGVTPRGAIFSWNVGAERLYGYRAAEVVGGPMARLWPVAQRELPAQLLARLRSGPIGPHVVTHVDRNGRPVEVLLSLAPVRDGGSHCGAAVIARELPPSLKPSLERCSGLKRRHPLEATRQLAGYLDACSSLTEGYSTMERLLPRLFPETTGALFEWDRARGRMESRASWGEAGGVPESFEPAHCWAWRQGRTHRQNPHGLACAHWGGGLSDAVCVPLAAAGEIFGVLSLGAAHRPRGRSFVPRTARVESAASQFTLALNSLRRQERLLDLSTRDPLTGLGNRLCLEQALPRLLERAAAAGANLSVVICDLDHFKWVNDSCGHAAGDRLLQAFGGLVRSCVRAGDLACRYGGDEFVLLLPDAPPLVACERAEAVRHAWEQRWLGDGAARITAAAATLSLGVASYPLDGDSAEALLGAADLALYRAKAKGRNQVAGGDGSYAKIGD